MNLKKYAGRVVLSMFCTVISPCLSAQSLSISELTQGLEELDLFSPDAGGAFVRSVDKSALHFPISIIEDRNGGFVIQLDGTKYYVGAADVVTNKKYKVSAKCDGNYIEGHPSAALRGIVGKGC